MVNSNLLELCWDGSLGTYATPIWEDLRIWMIEKPVSVTDLTILNKYSCYQWALPDLRILCFSFLFFSFIFISWRLVTLQYCSGFCHTTTWISHGFTCIPHPDPPSHLPLHLILWVFPVHQIRALVSCIQPGLVICFTLENTRFDAVFSKHPTLAFSHRVQKSVLYICVCSVHLCTSLHIGLSLPSF